jgi:hypothetical protein
LAALISRGRFIYSEYAAARIDIVLGVFAAICKTNLARLLARWPDGIFVAPFEQGEIAPDLFRHACIMGLEGMVSKRRDPPYRAGRSPHWIKVKNPPPRRCSGLRMDHGEPRDRAQAEVPCSAASASRSHCSDICSHRCWSTGLTALAASRRHSFAILRHASASLIARYAGSAALVPTRIRSWERLQTERGHLFPARDGYS